MALPVEDHALQEIGTAQEGAIVRIGAADDDMVAAAGAGVATVDHELVGAEPGGARLLVDRRGDVDAVLPVRSRMNIDLDDAGIRGDADDVDALVLRRRITFDMDGKLELGGGVFGGGDQLEIILDAFDRWHEDAEPAVARLDRHGGAYGAAKLAERLFDPAAIALVGMEGGFRHGPAGRYEDIRQRFARDRRIGGVDIRVTRRGNIGQRAERQAVSDRTVARDKEDLAAAGAPFLADPDPCFGCLGVPCLNRKDVTGRGREAAGEDAGDAVALLRILQLRIGRIDIFGKAAFLDDPVGRIFIGRLHHVRLDRQLLCDRRQELFGILGFDAGILAFGGDQIEVLPDRLAVAAPVKREGPARQAFARVPFSLAIMQKTAGGEAFVQLADQDVGLFALGRADGGGVPLLGLEIVDRNEGRLAAHRQMHVLGFEDAVDFLSEFVELLPAFIGKGLGDAWVFGDARDLHVEGELGFGLTEITAGNRRGVAVMRRCGKRDMAFAGQQAGRRIEANPAGAGQIDLRPGMQVGEIDFGAGGAVERLQVRRQLDEVTGDEAGGKAEMAKDLDEQPAGVAARALGGFQRFFRRLHAGFHTDDITDLPLQTGIQADDHIDRRLVGRPVERRQQRLQARTGRLRRHVDRQILLDRFRVSEGPLGRLFLDEEVEGIIDRHVGDEIDLDLELRHRVREDVAGKVVAVRILLQVDEMVGGRDLQRVAEHPCLRMRGGFQSDDLWAETDRLVIGVVSQMIDAGFDRHISFLSGAHRRAACCSRKSVCAMQRKKASERSMAFTSPWQR